MPKSLGILLTTWDGDSHHFGEILAEFTRLGYPFAVNFDHCCDYTKRLFKSHPLFCGCYENDDPNHLFDETHKQHALDVLVKQNFDWATYLDTDEVFDRRAPEMIPQILECDADLVWCPCLELWGDRRHYRVDGVLGPSYDPDECEDFPHASHRDKFYKLRTGTWRYLHGDVHAPYYFAPYKDRPSKPRRKRWPLYVIHSGRMDPEDALRHEEMWDTIYTRALGSNKYKGGYYVYVATAQPNVIEFDPETFDGK